MSIATDKLIKKKSKEIYAKNEEHGAASLNPFSAHPILYCTQSNVLFVLGIICLLAALLLFGFGEFIKDENKSFSLRFLAFICFGFGAYGLQMARKGRRLYELIDAYREALLDNGLRSITDFSTLTHSSSDEIVDELIELQEAGLFRQFSIDRKNKKFVENADWNDADSANYKQISFSCPSCGASNTIYANENSTARVCEYCGS